MAATHDALDRVEWHTEGSFPKELPKAAGATHIGMFLAWAIVQKREAYKHRESHKAELEAVRARTMTGAQFLLQCCESALTDEDLNGECAAFAHHYYERTYLTDFADALATDVDTPYHVADTWDAYDKIARVIDKRFDAWQEKRRAPPPKKKRRAKLKPRRG